MCRVGSMEANSSFGQSEDENPLGISDAVEGSGMDIHASKGGEAEACHSEQYENALAQKIAELEEALGKEENKYKRLLADFQNSRNRTAKDINTAVEQAERQILLDMLRLLDSFNRCLSSAYHDIADFRTGVELIQKQFCGALRRLEVSEIEINVGDVYDAHTAEALTTLDTQDYPEGCIVDICEKGYRFGGHLLRPARVVVASSGGSSNDAQV